MIRRPTIPDFKFTLSNRDLPPLSTLQGGIDALDLLFPVTLRSVQVSPEFVSLATIGGKAAWFSCEQRAISNLVDEKHVDLRSNWRFAYACGAIGEMLSSVVAGLVAEAYAYSTGGVAYHPDHGAWTRSDMFRQGADLVLAGELDRLDLYSARYPSTEDDWPKGPVHLVSIVR